SNVSIGSSTYTTLLAPTTGTRVNELKADGDGYFDGKIQFAGNNFLGHNQTLSFQLSAVNQDLGVEDFHFFSLPGGGSGSYIMASHIQNMPSTGDSLWVGTVAAVPLPGALLFFGSGLMGMLGFRNRLDRL
ncbi:MAG TPA: PEP-CTERM sorting domain-containing protein, partial [Nitrospira sp.]